MGNGKHCIWLYGLECACLGMGEKKQSRREKTWVHANGRTKSMGLQQLQLQGGMFKGMLEGMLKGMFKEKIKLS